MIRHNGVWYVDLYHRKPRAFYSLDDAFTYLIRKGFKVIGD